MEKEYIIQRKKYGGDNCCCIEIRNLKHTGLLFYYYKDDNTTCYVSNLYVEYKKRNQGIASKIMEIVFQKAKQYGFQYVCLTVEKNSWMEKWYCGLGFEIFGIIEKDSPLIWMRKNCFE